MLSICETTNLEYYISDEYDESFLHSNGRVLSTQEFWPTRADAEAILAKYPDAAPPVESPPPHEWVHGDVLESYDGQTLVCVGISAGHIRVFGVGTAVGEFEAAVNLDDEAKFLFNINDVVSGAVKERQAAIDAESGDDNLIVTKAGRVVAGLVSIDEMQEFVDYSKRLEVFKSSIHIHDRLANRFEKVLAQIEDER